MISIYLHIPFCERKCLYCDFYSLEGTSGAEVFLRSLQDEIGLRGSLSKGDGVDTIYFGGGTPSLLRPEQIEEILFRLQAVFAIAPSAEVTLEANPGTIDSKSLMEYKRVGVNRLSIGVQSFHNSDLIFLGRIHDVDQARECIRAARGAGFDNISLDLIYAIPGQSLGSWRSSLEEAIQWHPEHISAYSLIVEEGTPLMRLVEAGVVTPHAPEEEAVSYEVTMETLAKAGYEQYEVSNYARPGFRSRHNGAYWNHSNYLGFGPSAHSFWRHPGTSAALRWWNASDVGSYTRALEAGCLPEGSEEILGEQELVNERILLGLRSSGLDLKLLATDLGYELPRVSREVVDGLVAQGLAHAENDVIRLTSAGFLICDEIAARLMIP